MKRFYRLDGSSVLVTQKEWNRRTRIQDSAIRRQGKIPFRNRQNKVAALDLSDYRKRVTLQRRGRFYASNSFARLKRESTPAGQKRAEKRLKKEGFIEDQVGIPGERFYEGPSGTVCSMVELGAYMSEVFDVLPIVEKADGRPNIVTRVQFTVGIAGKPEREAVAYSFISSRRGQLTQTQRANDFRDKLAQQILLTDIEIPGYGDAWGAGYGRVSQTPEAPRVEQTNILDFECIELRSMYAVAPI